MSPHERKGRPQKRPPIQPELFQFEKLKTISYTKLKTELSFAEKILVTAHLKDETRPYLDFRIVSNGILNFYKSHRMSDLMPAELEIRTYLQNQKDLSQEVRQFIEAQVDKMFADGIANPNKDAKKLDGLSPRLLIEEFNENSPRNLGKDGREMTIDGDTKRAYFSLAFVYTAVSKLLETVEPQLAAAPLPKGFQAGK